jgi:chaperonin cofactor prefoldin
MDPELTRGFQELQAQVYDSRTKIATIETCQKLTTNDAKINDTLLEEFEKCDDIEKKYFYQPVGRMLVKKQGKEAQKFLLDRKKQYKERLEHYQHVKEACIDRVKEYENSLRELVNKKLNKGNSAGNANSESKETQDKPEAT